MNATDVNGADSDKSMEDYKHLRPSPSEQFSPGKGGPGFPPHVLKVPSHKSLNLSGYSGYQSGPQLFPSPYQPQKPEPGPAIDSYRQDEVQDKVIKKVMKQLQTPPWQPTQGAHATARGEKPEDADIEALNKLTNAKKKLEELKYKIQYLENTKE